MPQARFMQLEVSLCIHHGHHVQVCKGDSQALTAPPSLYLLE